MSSSTELVAQFQRNLAAYKRTQETVQEELREAVKELAAQKRRVDNLHIVLAGEKCWWGGCVPPHKATEQDNDNYKDALAKQTIIEARLDQHRKNYTVYEEKILDCHVNLMMARDSAMREGMPVMSAQELNEARRVLEAEMKKADEVADAQHSLSEALSKMQSGQVDVALAAMAERRKHREEKMRELAARHLPSSTGLAVVGGGAARA